MSAAFATEQLDGSFILRFPYNPDVIAQIKAIIPGYGRSYNPEKKHWTVESPFANDAIAILNKAFKKVTIERNAQRQHFAHSSGSVSNRAYADLHLLPSAPAELVGDAYRCLAKLYHPDKGGDGAAMQRINAAKDHLTSLGVFNRRAS